MGESLVIDNGSGYFRLGIDGEGKRKVKKREKKEKRKKKEKKKRKKK